MAEDTVKHKCKRCKKVDNLKYKTYWHRTRKGTGMCRSCAQIKRTTGYTNGIPSWNKGLKGYGKWAKWYPKGKLNPAWKGGVTSKSMKIRNSKEYAEWRKSVFERDDYTCKTCGQIGGKLVADHIKPFAYYKKDRLNIDNGQTLCYECHKKTDTYLSGALKYAN